MIKIIDFCERQNEKDKEVKDEKVKYFFIPVGRKKVIDGIYKIKINFFLLNSLINLIKYAKKK